MMEVGFTVGNVRYQMFARRKEEGWKVRINAPAYDLTTIFTTPAEPIAEARRRIEDNNITWYDIIPATDPRLQ